jgi:hypothetical protein
MTALTHITYLHCCGDKRVFMLKVANNWILYKEIPDTQLPAKCEGKLDLGSRRGWFWGILDSDLDPRSRSKSRFSKCVCPLIAG